MKSPYRLFLAGGDGSISHSFAEGSCLKEKAPMAPFASPSSCYMSPARRGMVNALRLDKTHREIKGPHMFGQGTDRNEVDTGSRIFGQGVQRDVAGHF